MAKKIESYNASYPAAYYEIGTVYAFYARGSASGTPATDKYIQRFSSVLKSLEAQQNANAIKPVKGGSNEPPLRKGGLTRHYAVVVEKYPTHIEVMFLNKDGNHESFLTRKYTVNGSATTDGKDLMAPTTHTTITGVKGGESHIGGITKIGGGSGNVGGITKIGNTSTSSAGIGGITKINKSGDSSTSTTRTVGGITRMNKDTVDSEPRVGGITRMKK